MWAGSSAFTANGVTWTPNTCTNTTPYSNSGSYSSPIYNATAYSTNLSAPITCSFPVVQGVYTIDIHLIESVRSFNAPLKRAFSIYANNTPLLTNIDIYQRAGAVEAPFDVTGITQANASGITITFVPSKSSAIFAGIELFPISTVGGCTLTGPNNADLTCDSITSGLPGMSGGITLYDMSSPTPLAFTFEAPLVLQQPFTLVAPTGPPAVNGSQISYSLDPGGTGKWLASWSVPVASIARSFCSGNCAGLQLFSLTMADGTQLGPYVAIPAGNAATSPNWYAVAPNAPDPPQAPQVQLIRKP